jgi:hypothetical protein
MALSRKYRTTSEAPRGPSSRWSIDRKALDQIGRTEAVRAACAAVTALADTLNALGLRIAVAKNTYDRAEDSNPSYHNLALLAESASGQVRSIQKLLRAIELTALRNESEQIDRNSR